MHYLYNVLGCQKEWVQKVEQDFEQSFKKYKRFSFRRSATFREPTPTAAGDFEDYLVKRMKLNMDHSNSEEEEIKR
ncbi:hypothetical protein HDU91_003707, partial [Kappamyces sp. JEL0680]